MNDDPREVLALLNSLGFIGITAQQLKDFMKDLKLYRKVKEYERQQRKEEMRKKIIEKQQNVIKEVLREQKKEFYSIENTISTDSSNSYTNHSLVKVKVKCLSSDKENEGSTNTNRSYIGTKQKLHISKSKCKKAFDYSNIKSSSTSCNDENNKGDIKGKDKCFDYSRQDPCTSKKYRIKIDSNKMLHHEKSIASQIRPTSAPNILEHECEYVGSNRAKSTSSTKTLQSATKSFIRPWRLQSESQKSLNVKKSDPVTLYQKYQQEWKQMSFPGEAKHASLRWAIREKMLGGDPHPMPPLKKSVSISTLRKK